MNLDSKIFVAGGTGLVGSAIIKNLQEKGYNNIIANYHTRQPLVALNTSHIAQTNSVHYVKLDLLDSNAVSDFFKAESPEFVFLAAAKVGGIVANNTYRADFIYENLQIQNNIIHQSYKNDVKKLMFLGSTCIYPKNAPQPMPEDCLLTDTLEYTNEPYAIAKIAGIKMCESYNLQYGTNYISVMPTNLYGPNDNFDLEKSHVLPALIRKIHLGKALEENDWDAIREDLEKLPIEDINGTASEEEIKNILEKNGIKNRNTSHVTRNTTQIEIWGSGKPMREFLWSHDMADACVFLMENRDFSDILDSERLTLNAECSADGKPCESLNAQPLTLNAEIRNTHINIGTGIDISIHDLAHTIKDIVGFSGELYFNTDKPDGTMKKLTDVSKLHSLGWHHKIDLEEGIEKMYNWYKEGNE
jgi:GDP-L-fucose synthase